MRQALRSTPARGASLIEVLVALLILSFGVLSLGSMMAFAVQLPKLSGYRATATNLAASHVERIRANPAGFYSGDYAKPLATLDGTSSAPCAYPHCTASSLADMDTAIGQEAARTQLPAGGLLTTCDPSPCAPHSYGNVWVVWQEPSTFAALNAAASDHCPDAIAVVFPQAAPRCLHIRFKP